MVDTDRLLIRRCASLLMPRISRQREKRETKPGRRLHRSPARASIRLALGGRAAQSTGPAPACPPSSSNGPTHWLRYNRADTWPLQHLARHGTAQHHRQRPGTMTKEPDRPPRSRRRKRATTAPTARRPHWCRHRACISATQRRTANGSRQGQGGHRPRRDRDPARWSMAEQQQDSAPLGARSSSTRSGIEGRDHGQAAEAGCSTGLASSSRWIPGISPRRGADFAGRGLIHRDDW